MTNRSLIAAGFGLAVAAFVLSQASASQQSYQQRRVAQSKQAEARGLAEPFKGVTTGGTVEAGLFSLQSTGVSTAPVQRAAEEFLDVLTGAQRTRTVFSDR